MRIVAFITQTSVIDQILTHLRTRATPGGARRCPESPLDPGTGDPERGTIGAVTSGRPARALMAPTLAPAQTSGTRGVRGRRTRALHRCAPAPCSRRDTGPDGPRGAPTRPSLPPPPARRSSRGGGTPPDTRPTPIEIPIAE